MIPNTDPTRAWTHPDGTTFLPIRRVGCQGCAGMHASYTSESGFEGTYPCEQLPHCAPVGISLQWVHDTPENRALFVIQRMGP